MSDAELKPRVQSAARVVDILQQVARADSRGLPRQVVYHLAHTLVAMNMLRKAGRGSYLLGLGAAVIAEGFRRQMGTGDFVAAYAERAAEATGETAYIVGWVEKELVVLGTARGKGVIQAAEGPRGAAGDAHARASGKLMLAMASDAEVDGYLGRHSLRRRTPATITTRKALSDELSRIRECWFATERGEYEVGLSCLAVPVGSVPSMMVLAISAL